MQTAGGIDRLFVMLWLLYSDKRHYMETLGHSFSKITQKAQLLLKRSADRHLRLAVTGLSGAGKTAFVTGLVNQLASTDICRQLPLWQVCRQQRLIGVKRVMQPDLNIASFDYQASIRALTQQPPMWPASTKNISELRLAIKYRPNKGLLSHLTDSAILYLDIVDYPGEWLLDLPMVRHSYASWCQLQSSRSQRLASSPFYANYLQALQSLRLDQTADEDELKHIAELYRLLLNDLVNVQGFYLAQPGRMLLPGELDGTPLLTFFPILSSDPAFFDNLEKSPANTSYQVLKQRYQQYVSKVVKPFYRDYFSGFDRQVVLVDCLSALNQGRGQFDDMREALASILESFEFGKSTLLKRLFSPKIDKLLFAASKIDHVSRDQQPNVLSLLTAMLRQSQQAASFEGCDVETMAISAITATQAGRVKTHKGEIEVIKGVSLASGQAITLFPGEVPPRLPKSDFWSQQGFDFCAFQPPQLTENQPNYQHIRLDHMLEFLLGDKLQ